MGVVISDRFRDLPFCHLDRSCPKMSKKRSFPILACPKAKGLSVYQGKSILRHLVMSNKGAEWFFTILAMSKSKATVFGSIKERIYINCNLLLLFSLLLCCRRNRWHKRCFLGHLSWRGVQRIVKDWQTGLNVEARVDWR